MYLKNENNFIENQLKEVLYFNPILTKETDTAVYICFDYNSNNKHIECNFGITNIYSVLLN